MSNHGDTYLPTHPMEPEIPERRELDAPVNLARAVTLPLFAARPESKALELRAGVRAGTRATPRVGPSSA